MLVSLRVQNFRKHSDVFLEFQPGQTVITGPNGSGKTSIIEALYIVLQGKSWRSNFKSITTNKGATEADWWRIDATFADGESRTVKFQNGVKTFTVNERETARLPIREKKPVILFEPNDLQLVYGSPTRRRDFFDRFISQIEPGYATTLRHFERVLMQRNSLLRQGTSQDELFVWDMQFVSLAEKTIESRTKWIDLINNTASNHYQAIAANSDLVTVKYHAPQRSSQQILTHLNKDFEQGVLFTKTGPQTHDVVFELNKRDAKLTASRGENRTILFAVLNAMIELINTTLEERVYLVFDDVDSELDLARKGKLYHSPIFTANNLFATTIQHTGDGFSNWIQLD